MDDFDKRIQIREEEIEALFKKALTYLNQAMLDIEALILVGTIKEKDRNHYINSEVKKQLLEVIKVVNAERLNLKHGVDKDIDNVSFIEEHPSFMIKKLFDELEKESDE